MPQPGQPIRLAGPRGGPGTADPGRITYQMLDLRTLMTLAFDVKMFQISGPPFLDTERFDISATMPPDTTKENFRLMLQNLLAERFGMKFHKETKELPMYGLSVAKGGPKLKESTVAEIPADGTPPPPLPAKPVIGADGFPLPPEFPAGRAIQLVQIMPQGMRMILRLKTMQDFAAMLGNMLKRPVVDETGLSGKYDFTLTYSRDGLPGLPGMPVPPPPPPEAAAPPGAAPRPAESDSLPSLFSAVQSQLGMKLDAKKGPVEMIVIDHIGKAPTEN